VTNRRRRCRTVERGLPVNRRAGDLVRLATCNGDDAEMWTNNYTPVTKRTEFVSWWGLFDDGGAILRLSEDYNNGNRLASGPVQLAARCSNTGAARLPDRSRSADSKAPAPAVPATTPVTARIRARRPEASP
jgi:hypothetical protein